ncbi:MAG TPA: ABC transporter transmembrane domain-containing protein [Candidatus Paceibacterota bacterium]|nr:ABC transporter transmembrane domain-containing protein [Candidatus Paceibacterota bacterium]
MQKQKTFFKNVVYFFRPFWKWLFIVTGILIFIQLVGTLSPYLFGQGVDAVIHSNVRLTFVYLGIAFLISLFQSVGLWWFKESIELRHLDDHVEKVFSVDSLDKMLSFSIGQHINEHSGVKQSIVTKGQSSLENLMYAILYTVLPAGLQILVTLIVLAIFDWKIAGVALVFVILYVWVSLNRNKKFFPIIEEIRKKYQSQGKLQSELYRNSSLAISEAQESKTSEDFEKFTEDVTNFGTGSWQKFLKPFYLQSKIAIKYWSSVMEFSSHKIVTMNF